MDYVLSSFELASGRPLNIFYEVIFQRKQCCVLERQTSTELVRGESDLKDKAKTGVFQYN